MPPFKIKGLRWWMIGLIMVGSMINFLTRSTLSVAVATSPLMQDLHIDDKHYGWITGVFQITLMLQPVCGYVFDVVGLRLGFAIFAVVWSFTTMAHGLARSWQTLAGLRGLLGFCEGSANPAGMKAVAEWFPARERGFAGGAFNIGASVGSLIAAPLVGLSVSLFNWRVAFMVTGALGLIWVVFWWLCYRPPAEHPALSPAERDYIAAGQESHLQSDGASPSVFSILGRRNFWGIALPRFLADPTWGILTLWMPRYLNQVRHFDLKQIALTAWLPFLAADLGCMFGGTVVHHLQKRGVGLINARRGAFTLGAFLMTGMAFVGFVHSPAMAVLLLCLGGFAHQTLSVTVITMSSDLFKRNEVATVAGMAGTCGNAGVLIFTLVIGGLVATIGYTPFFMVLAALDLVGAVILWTVVREGKSAMAAV